MHSLALGLQSTQGEEIYKHFSCPKTLKTPRNLSNNYMEIKKKTEKQIDQEMVEAKEGSSDSREACAL